MSQPPRLALSILKRYVPDNEPLVGDIVEQFAARPSHLWLWRQVFSAVAAALLRSDGEIRPLQLVEHQPFDALQRTFEVHRRLRDVSPTPHPLPAGLGLVILGGLVTALAPIIWWGLLAAAVGGLALAGLLVSAHRRRASRSAARLLT